MSERKLNPVDYLKMAIPLVLLVTACNTAERVANSQANVSASQPVEQTSNGQNYTELPARLKNVAVHQGEYLGSIAERCNVSYEEALKINGERNNLFAGESVQMPEDASCQSIEEERAALAQCQSETVSISYDARSWEDVANQVGVNTTRLLLVNGATSNSPVQYILEVPRCD